MLFVKFILCLAVVLSSAVGMKKSTSGGTLTLPKIQAAKLTEKFRSLLSFAEKACCVQHFLEQIKGCEASKKDLTIFHVMAVLDFLNLSKFAVQSTKIVWKELSGMLREEEESYMCFYPSGCVFSGHIYVTTSKSSKMQCIVIERCIEGQDVFYFYSGTEESPKKLLCEEVLPTNVQILISNGAIHGICFVVNEND